MPRPTHFEIHAENPERAITFYKKMFGWEFTKWEGPMPYWLITTGDKEPGINGGLMPRMGPLIPDAPVIAYVCTMMVDDLDSLVDRALKSGGTMALPRMPIPGMGWLAYVKDTEGNIFGMMQADEKAA
ncbi:MAG: VOC family protein [Gemmatimonadales bacterium]|nr:VOC family protein [Gemmatimonadales bacterium]